MRGKVFRGELRIKLEGFTIGIGAMTTPPAFCHLFSLFVLLIASSEPLDIIQYWIIISTERSWRPTVMPLQLSLNWERIEFEKLTKKHLKFYSENKNNVAGI